MERYNFSFPSAHSGTEASFSPVFSSFCVANFSISFLMTQSFHLIFESRHPCFSIVI